MAEPPRAVFAVSVLRSITTVPWLKIAPPRPAPPPPPFESPPLATPPESVSSCSVSAPAPGVTYPPSAPTKKKRNLADAAGRAIVAPLPAIVMSLAIGGRPFGPYQWLCGAVSV